MTETGMRRLADVPLLQAVPAFTVSLAEARRVVAPLPADEVDWGLVVALRRRASDQVAEAALEHAERTGVPLGDADRRLMARSVLREVVRGHAEERSRLGDLWTVDREQRYASALEDAIFGFGRMQPLFELAGAENIEIHGHDSVVAQYGDGHREALPPVADSDEELVEAVRFLGESVSPPRPFDDAHPTMTLALGDSHRLHAIGFGLSYRGM